MVLISLIRVYLPCCFFQSILLAFSQRMDFSLLRAYLGEPVRKAARDVMLDALVFLIPGAVYLIDFLLRMRVNRRTRRTFEDAVAALAMANPPKWLGVLSKQLWNLYLLGLIQDFPFAMQFCFVFCRSYLVWRTFRQGFPRLHTLMFCTPSLNFAPLD